MTKKDADDEKILMKESFDTKFRVIELLSQKRDTGLQRKIRIIHWNKRANEYLRLAMNNENKRFSHDFEFMKNYSGCPCMFKIFSKN